jgi:SAM-dependent methyltransferase
LAAGEDALALNGAVRPHFMHEPDVPSPIDLCDPVVALEWERTAQARPGRAQMFQVFASQLRSLGRRDLKVLDLGSGPGFLGEFLLDAMPDLELTLLDFSPAMHELARIKLKVRAAKVAFLNLSFKSPDWASGLGMFDAVVTNQAVHELRHKRYAEALHSQVASVLGAGSPYLVCDHFYGEDGQGNNQLYMSVDEQQQALLDAGFKSVEQLLKVGTLVMHRAIW